MAGKFFCLHDWEAVKMVFTPPPLIVPKVSGTSEDYLAKLVFGFTTVYQVCKKCEKPHTFTLSGDQTKEGVTNGSSRGSTSGTNSKQGR